MQEMYNVYMHRNATTGNPFYIGCGKGDRYLRTSNKTKRYYALAGEGAPITQILAADIPTKALALELEDLVISMVRDDYELANYGTNSEVASQNGKKGYAIRTEYNGSLKQKEDLKRARALAPSTNGINALKRARETMTPERKREIAQIRANKRWDKYRALKNSP
jgi:hypothetical protein